MMKMKKFGEILPNLSQKFWFILIPVFLSVLNSGSVLAQFPYPDTVTNKPPAVILQLKSNKVAAFTWTFIRAANPGFALINEGGVYQQGYTSQWGYMVGKTGNTKLFAEYTYVPDRFIPHIFHTGVLLDIVTYVDQGLIFNYRYGFTPGIGLYSDFKDYGLSLEYAAWYEVIQFTRLYARYRFNFWVSQPSIGFQDFAFGIGLPL